MQLDIAISPFSRYGNYHSIQTVSGGKLPSGDGLYLMSHHGARLAERAVARLELLDAKGRARKARIEARPTELILHDGGDARVHICMTQPDVLRVRGEGAGLRVTVPIKVGVVAYPAGEGRWALNARRQIRRYLFEPLQGRLEADVVWAANQCERIAFDLLPGADGVMEVAVDDFLSAWTPRPRPSYQELLAEVEQDYAAWLAKTPDAPEEMRATWEHAAYVNWSAVVSPSGHFKRPAMLMSKRHMENVWSWDHCFNAMALSYKHPDLAWDQLLVPMDHQDEFGAFPDACNDLHMHYNYSKPPVHGWALNFMLARNPALATPEHLAEVYPILCRWSEFWLQHRTMPGDRLPYYLHGNDSGWDNSTMFDLGAPLVAPDLASLLVIQLETLADVAERLGKPEDATAWKERADALYRALLEELWRGDHFTATLPSSGNEVQCDSLIPCVPLVLGNRLPAPIRTALVKRLKGFLTKHGLATERVDSPHYQSDGYWRGPIWAPPTLLILTGLQEIGEHRLARTIAERFCRTCARQGFAENFDALTGAGLRDRAYTWTSSTYLILAHEFCG